MSLYLSEWIDGPNVFYDLGSFAWNPKVFCKVDSDNPGQVKASVSMFDADSINSIVDVIGSDLGRKFVGRLNESNKYVLTKLEVKRFFDVNLNPVWHRAGSINEAEEVLTQLFTMFLMDYEFWHRIDLVDMYTNLIFYGVEHNPNPVFILTPPMSEWDDIDGWSL